MKNIAKATVIVSLLLGATNAQAGWYWWWKPVPKPVPKPTISCGAVLGSGKHTLTQDLHCAKGPAITLSSYADLQMNGHTISTDRGNCVVITGNKNYLRSGKLLNCKNGVRIKGDYNWAYRLTIENSKLRGVFATGTGNTIYANKISGSGDDGIELLDSVASKISSNTINYSGSEAIGVEGGWGNYVNRNIMEYGNEEGIELEGDTYGNQVHFNKANGSYKYGIHIEEGSTKNVLTNNSAYGNGMSDMADDNYGCGGNKWSYSKFDTSSEYCIK